MGVPFSPTNSRGASNSNIAMKQIGTGTAALWLCYGGMVSIAIAVNFVPVYLTTFSETFGGETGLTEEQLGRIPACIFATLVLGILVGGPLADRLGAKPFAVIGLAMTCAGLGVLATAGSYQALLGAGAILGFGAGALDMVLSPIVCALRPNRRASALNWLHSFYCVGAVGTVLIGSGALYVGIPWRAVAAALIALPAVLLIGFARLHIPPLVHEDAERERLRTLVRHPAFLLALLAIMMAGGTEAGMAQWLPAYAERVLGYTKAEGALALAGFSVAMVAGRMMAAALEHRVRPILLMVVSCGILVFLFGVGCSVPRVSVALAACIAVGLPVSCLWPTTLGVTADRFPHGGASLFALLAAAGNAGCFAVPWIVGIVAERSTLSAGLATAGACPALMAVILVSMHLWKPVKETVQ